MRIIESEKLRQYLLGKFPRLNLDRLRLSDIPNLLPPYEYLKKMVEEHSSKEIVFKSHIGECEEYTCYLRSDIKKARHVAANRGLIPVEEMYSLTIGESDGILNNKFYKNEYHTMDVAVTDDMKIWYIENQTATIYPYNLKHFDIYRIWM